MKDELISFQKRALVQLRNHCAAAHNEYRNSKWCRLLRQRVLVRLSSWPR